MVRSRKNDITNAAVRVPATTAAGMANMRSPTALKLLMTLPSIPRSIPTNMSRRHSPSFIPRPAALSKTSMFPSNISLITKYPANIPIITDMSMTIVIILTFCFSSSFSMACTCSLRSAVSVFFICAGLLKTCRLSVFSPCETRPYLSIPRSFLTIYMAAVENSMITTVIKKAEIPMVLRFSVISLLAPILAPIHSTRRVMATVWTFPVQRRLSLLLLSLLPKK